MRFLKGIIVSLDEDCKDLMEDTMKEWQQRRRGGAANDSTANANENAINVPLGQGEFDEPLGIPLCVACHGVSYLDA